VRNEPQPIPRTSFSYLPVVRCARVGLLPSRSGRIAMYAAAINRPSRTIPSRRVPIASALTGVVACQLGRCLQARPRRWPSPSGLPRGAIIADAVQQPASSSTRSRPALLPTGDRDRRRRPTHREGARGVMRFRVPAASSWRCARSLAVGPAGSPVRWTTGGSPHQAQDSAKVRLETVADGLTPALPWVPEVERPSPCR
jgi:hypothetical protein